MTLAEASTATTAGIGVITSRASCSCRWKTPRSITASPGSRSPPTADWEMISFRSSEVCFSSMSAGRIPNRRRIAFDALFNAQVSGAVAERNRSSGRARWRAVPSARVIAISFGTCSPAVMWSEVAIVKAIAKASAVATPCESPPNSGSIRLASAGSPRKPIPIEAIVIPSWQAERYSSMRSSCTQHQARALRALAGELLHLAATGADQRELGGDEDAVDQHQRDQRNEGQSRHRSRRSRPGLRPSGRAQLPAGRGAWGPVLEGSSSIIGDRARLPAPAA